MLGAVKQGRMSVPLDNPNLGIDAGLPWCSIATLWSGHEEVRRLVGPAIRQPKQRVFPVFETELEGDAPLTAYEREATSLRRGLGLEPVSV